MPTLVPVTQHNENSHVVPHFDKHGVVLFMMPSESCDTDTGTNGVS